MILLLLFLLVCSEALKVPSIRIQNTLANAAAVFSLSLTPTLFLNSQAIFASDATICPSALCPQGAKDLLVQTASFKDKEMLKSTIASWGTWNSEESGGRYAVGISRKKEYNINELCYIDKGKFTITPEIGKPIIVKSGDFVLFPKGLKCTWEVQEPVYKHWYEYE